MEATEARKMVAIPLLQRSRWRAAVAPCALVIAALFVAPVAGADDPSPPPSGANPQWNSLAQACARAGQCCTLDAGMPGSRATAHTDTPCPCNRQHSASRSLIASRLQAIPLGPRVLP